MNETGIHAIRPAGRLILTIGRELIQDPYAAVVELVKNAYDADSPDVSVVFQGESGSEAFSIIVSDHGHGMTRDDVINRWMVPSTADKLQRRTSPSGRVMQGRKGVGRYAASVLGDDLLLETITAGGEKTEVYLEWRDFENSDYLDDVEVLVSTSETSETCGTRLTMSAGTTTHQWDARQFDKLRFELRRLKSPVDIELTEDDFQINLEVNGFADIDDISEVIKPYPIFSLFDYRISGRVNSDGSGVLEYSLQKVRNSPLENISFDYGMPTGCGELSLDIRVYDRDGTSITSLIGRGLRDDSGHYVGNLQARRLLNEYNGIGVYRNGFRIRPLGDPDFDWLKLNERRVQNPSFCIGSNQVIGFVQIQSDEESNLIEKSARDGLRENRAYENLKDIAHKVIAELESRRFRYRRNAGLAASSVKIEREIERLFSADELKRDVQRRLSRYGVGKEATAGVLAIITRDEEDRNKVVEDIRKTVAIYQGQATLGKIINVILHDGRRPLSYFRNMIPDLRYWYKLFQENGNNQDLSKALAIVDGVGDNAEHLVALFGRIDPLAAGQRGPKRDMDLYKEITGALSVFTATMETQRVDAVVDCPEGFTFLGWPQDIYYVFTNLIDNSLYWMEEKGAVERKILVEVVAQDGALMHIDYRDTGPGIDPTLIETEVIFEPQFSTKPFGTGIGLPIAGEAAARNGLELRALESDSGAWFRLQSILEDEE